jgi:UDP-2,3-diacylglucosamine pyrophosphatase LpxH
MRRVVISDVHIGSKKYKAKELIAFLQKAEYDQLILAGDIIDFIKIPTFTSKFLDIIKAIDFSKDIIYVVGNHEFPLRKLVGESLYNVRFVDKYEFRDNGRLFRIEHGDRYEKGLVHIDFLMKVISIVHDWIDRTFDIDLATWYVERKLKKRKLRRIWDILKWNVDVDVIIMGHSHHPEAIIWVDNKQDIKTYVNCGDWVAHQSWVLIEDGVVRLKSEDDSNFI